MQRRLAAEIPRGSTPGTTMRTPRPNRRRLGACRRCGRNRRSASRRGAVEHPTAKRLGESCRLLFPFEIDPADIRAGDLPETDGLEFHMVEPGSHLAQLAGQIPGIDSYFDN